MADRAVGGFSTASLDYEPAEPSSNTPSHARFHGSISTKLPDNWRVERTGMLLTRWSRTPRQIKEIKLYKGEKTNTANQATPRSATKIEASGSSDGSSGTSIHTRILPCASSPTAVDTPSTCRQTRSSRRISTSTDYTRDTTVYTTHQHRRTMNSKQTHPMPLRTYIPLACPLRFRMSHLNRRSFLPLPVQRRLAQMDGRLFSCLLTRSCARITALSSSLRLL